MATAARIGQLDVTALVDVTPPPRDVSQVFTDVPSNAWDPYRSFALDENGMWQTQFCSFLIRPADGSGPAVLVDTGLGPGPHEPNGRQGALLGELGTAGVQAQDIEAVVITHPHGDHIGWNVTYDGDEARLTFPNAAYWVARADWEYWTQPDVMSNAPAVSRSLRPLEELGALRLSEGVKSVAPGVETTPANGHTPGHQCVSIDSGGETGIVIGDLFHNVAQVTEQAWRPVFDWNPDMARRARQGIIAQAASEGWTVFAGHLPIGRNIGRIEPSRGTHVWRPL